MNETPHFATVESWADAEELIGFAPLQPFNAEGNTLDSLRVHVMDHRMRELPAEARRLAYDVSYGAAVKETTVGGHEARAYDEGPVPEPDDPDGQMPAVVVWPDGDLFLLVASGELDVPALLRIAASIYA